ncbi:MAG: SH3 domain-containing protein [Bdellovibrionales bacterium]|nr:SH3 domain-containing protein [Bdellovibrionales bacterium]
MLKIFGFVLGFFVVNAALVMSSQAAQVGKIVVDTAEVHEYPQAGSKVIAKVSKNESVTVSNVPTEGFYKARVRSGQIGWISGNDILVSNKGASRSAPSRRGWSRPEDTRVQLTYGMNSASLGGMATVFGVTSYSMKAFNLEAQFRLSEKMFWAIRTGYITGSASGDLGTGTVQDLKTTAIPVQAGINYTAYKGQSIRAGLGAYLGMAVISSTTVTQTSAALVEEVKYSSLDPTGALVLQGVYSFSDALGGLLELGYRYHKTGEFGSTTRFGGKSGFAIDYSGVTISFGLEMKL